MSTARGEPEPPTIRLGRAVTVDSVESALAEWSAMAESGDVDQSTPVVISLQTVEFAEFGALAMLLLLIERICRSGRKVAIELPAPTTAELRFVERNRSSEARAVQDAVARTDAAAARRREALAWLDHTGFLASLALPHLPRGSVSVSPAIGQVTHGANEPRLRQIFPFRWAIPSSVAAARSEIVMSAMVGLQGFGLAPADARDLANALVRELVENVGHHAGELESALSAPHALVGAALLDPTAYELRPDDFPDLLRPFITWAQGASSPVLRLIIGDSGVGLVTRLSPHLPQRPSLTGVEDSTLSQLSTDERTVLWAMERWSTSEPRWRGARRGTRGLWRVQRIVRSYRGSLLIRAGLAHAGLVHGPSARAQAVHALRSERLRGTILDVLVLPKASEGAARPSRLEWPSETPLAWTWLPAQLDDENTDAAGLAERMAAKAAAEPPSEAIAVTVESARATQPLGHTTRLGALTDAADIANPTVVGLVFPLDRWTVLDDARDAIESSTDDLSAAPDLGASHRLDPVLVVDALGEGRFVAGTRAERSVLRALTAHGGPATYGDLLSAGLPPDISREDVARIVRDQPRLVHRASDGRIALTASSADLVAALDRQVSARLRSAVETAGTAAVRAGLFMTPTMRLTRRWVSTEALLMDGIGMGVAAFLLAHKARLWLSNPLPPNVRLYRVPTASEGLAAALTQCMQLSAPAGAMPGELDLDAVPPSDRAAPGADVILLTDVLSTENSVRRAVTEVAGWGAHPCLILTVLDGRPEGGPVSLLGREIPVVALADVDLDARGDDKTTAVTYIDPLLRAPVDARDVSPTYAVAEKDLLDWCRSVPEAIGLGHIERPVHGHFSAYLDPSQLMAESSRSRDALLDAFTNEVVEWLRALDERREGSAESTAAAQGHADPSPGRSLSVWFPGSSRDYAGGLARLLEPRLARVRGVGQVTLQPVPRAAAGGRWAFPAAVEPLPPGTDVVIVDWGAVEAGTAHQMIRLGADAGADSIVAVVLLSQMPVQEERTLTMVGAMDGLRTEYAATGDRDGTLFTVPAAEEAPTVMGTTVPTRVRFVTRVSIGPVARSECGMCRLRDQINADIDHLPPPLAEHARGLVSALAPVIRSQASWSRDVLGVPVTAAEKAEYVDLRGRFTRALRSTEHRHLLVTELADVAAGATAQEVTRAWLRLLAAEAHWLRLPPLRHHESRQLLGRAALGWLRGSGGGSAHTGLRQQAAMVLGAATPTLLVHELVALLGDVDEMAVVMQLLYEVHRYLDHPPEDNPVHVQEIYDALSSCIAIAPTRRNRAPETGAEPGDAPPVPSGGLRDADVLGVLKDLHMRAEVQVRQRGVLRADQAWSMLKMGYRERLREHPPAEGAVTRMLLVIDGLENGAPDVSGELWQQVMADWRVVRGFLVRNVLPYLTAIRPILTGPYFSQHMQSDLDRLVGLSELRSSTWLDKVAGRLTTLARAGAPTTPQEMQSWEQMIEDLTWLHETLLSSEPAPGSSGDIAHLAAWLDAAPMPCQELLDDVVDVAYARWELQMQHAVGHDVRVEVFCDRSLLREAVLQLIANAIDPRHRQPEHAARTPTVQVELTTPDPGEVRITVRNDRTRPTSTGGAGLDAYRRKIGPYGGRLVRNPSPPSPWTFEVTLVLPAWQDADPPLFNSSR